MIFCSNCQHYIDVNRTQTIPACWVEPHDGKGFGCVISGYRGYLCCHDKCFTHEMVTTHESQHMAKIRISGQAILNNNNDCPYFEQKKSLWGTLKSIFK